VASAGRRADRPQQELRHVIAEADQIVPVGAIPPDAVRTPGVLVDYLLERPS